MFKRSAQKVVDLLPKGTDVVVNPGWDDKPRVRPRKGTFEIRVRKGTKDADVVLSLVGMPRPFRKLRESDLEAVAADVAGRL